MGAEPDGLGNGTASLFSHLLRHAGHQESVLAVTGVGAVALGGADGKNQDIVLL